MESAAAVDVVIIGGGIVGTVLAKALAEKYLLQTALAICHPNWSRPTQSKPVKA